MPQDPRIDDQVSPLFPDPGPVIEAYQTWIDGGDPVENPGALFDRCCAGEFDFFGPFYTRTVFIEQIGFAIIAASGVEFVKSFGPILEIGAGSGYLSQLIRNAGGDAIATDIARCSKQPNLPVEILDAETAITTHPNRTILSSWPSLNEDWLAHAAQKMTPGQKLIVIGEGPGGATASDAFFDLIGTALLEVTNQFTEGVEMPLLYSLQGIHDRISVFQRLG